ncbi:c-type cytochrome [Halomonas korlensis]|uniref:Cytochrome c, mono-and diheme variants n=1 Tax=Halomonas korlensis TaxID=463301 RepID=A0A1I7J8H1_9GAMM|nr:cytochrome c [Halomonas korlensis]SFU81499.1 Cytochrome c, mono-and diheme variants [Halomonas korlensis]
MHNTTTVPSRHLPSLRLKPLALLGALLLPSAVAAAPDSEPDVRDPAEVYRQVCAHCHAPDKAVGPEITMAFPEAAHEARGDYVRMVVRNGRAAMPSFREAKISDPELEALIEALVSGDLADHSADKE